MSNWVLVQAQPLLPSHQVRLGQGSPLHTICGHWKLTVRQQENFDNKFSANKQLWNHRELGDQVHTNYPVTLLLFVKKSIPSASDTALSSE